MKMTVIGGGGHVGLPFSIVFASAGIQVTALDTSEEKIAKIKEGIMPFLENGAEELLREVIARKTFHITSDISSVASAEIATIVIGTPVDEYLTPDPNNLIELVKTLIPYLNKNQLIILRSTIFPGVSKSIELLLNSFFPGIDIAYCPERIVEGQAIEELKRLPQIIGTNSETAYQRTKALWEQLGVNCLRSSPEEAELAKIFTNVWRYIKFATANQFYMISNDLGIDYEKVRTIISYEYPRAQDLPSAGLTAGPCLFKDTMQLSALMNQKFMLGHSAMLINEGVPNYIVEKLKIKYQLNEMSVGILGMTFKANVDDIRGSLAFKLRKLLAFECKNVFITDEFFLDDRIIPLDDVIEQSDILIIGAPHPIYKDLKPKKPVIDIWNLLNEGVII